MNINNTTWKCPECGTEHDMDSLFCSVCGTKRPEHSDPEPGPEQRLCPVCGARASSEAVFCVNCGAKLTSLGEEEVSTDSKNESPASDEENSDGAEESESGIGYEENMKDAEESKVGIVYEDIKPDDEKAEKETELSYDTDDAADSAVIDKDTGVYNDDEIAADNIEKDVGTIDLAAGDKAVFLSEEDAMYGCRRDVILPDGRNAYIDIPGRIVPGSRMKLNSILNKDQTVEDIILDIVIG